MDEEEKTRLIQEHLGEVLFRLPDMPTIDDLFKFATVRRPKRWKRNRRLYKKFKKHFHRYVPQSIRNEFMAKMFASVLRRRLDTVSIARKILRVEPLPEGVLAHYPPR